MTLSLVLLCVLIVWLVTCGCCPPPALTTRHASESCSNSTHYHCLWNKRKKEYYEVCLNTQQFPAGSYAVYATNLDARECPSNRYQPFPFQANELNACVYMKSTCTEEGQMNATLVSTTDDATCKCDFTKGYSYVVLPKDPCSCKPSEEDCSCYITDCLNGTHKLSPDYKCERIDINLLRQYKCPRITFKGTDIVHHKPRNNTIGNESKKNVVRQSGYQRLFLFSAVAGMVMLLFIECIVVILSQDKTEELGGEALITRNGFQKSKEALEKYRLVVIKGRYGTGKSFMAEQLANKIPDYKRLMMQKEDLRQFINAVPGERNHIIVFDEVCDVYEDDKGRSKIIKVIETFYAESSNLLIITVGEFNNAFLESLRKMSLVGDDNLIDLDTEFALSKEEKLCMFNHYLKQLEAKQGDRSSLLVSLLHDNVKEAIVSTDTYQGFPLLCTTFCRELNNIKLGPKYFRQPPQQLIDEIERIRLDCTASHESSRIQYSILIYILLSMEGYVNIQGIHSELILEIGRYYFGLGFLHEDLIRYLQMKDIPLQRFLQHMGDGKYTMHPSVYQAVLLSFGVFSFKEVVEKCKLEHVLDLYRMPYYKPLPNETVLLCKKDEVMTFCKIVAKRMANKSLLDENTAHIVCQYIVKTQNDFLSQQYFSCLEEEIRKFITSKRVHLMLIIFKELVLEAKCRHVKNNMFLTAWTILVYNKYGEFSLIADLIKTHEFLNTTNFLVAMLGTIVDEYDNNMLAYCTLWWTTDSEHPFVKAVSNLLSHSLVQLSPEHVLKRTKGWVSPIHFAAYFGRHHCLQTFLPRHERDTEGRILGKAAFHKLRNEAEELIELARKGETKLLLDKIKYNTEMCPKVEIGTVIDFEKTHTVLENFRKKLAHHHDESNK